ncbi:MAG: SMP-30/gluconolactonase/LRE family protein [Burkholderiaceae bacterium]|nr:SMP-30/gluconolactonase/LRE family protein [Burkholderiaceae bacterium]
MPTPTIAADITALPVAPSLLGESPLWHPDEQVLYWVDIPGLQLNRFDPASGRHDEWHFASEPSCCAPLLGGGLLLAMRDGLWRFDTASGRRSLVANPPYDPAGQRFNDGKADPQGRFWVGTIDDQRRPEAALYRLAGGALTKVADGIAASNGLGFDPAGRTMYWADTKAHVVHAFDFDGHDGSLSRRRVFQQFAPRAEGQPLAAYGGRPDGAAVDAEGAYWVAMFEGQRLLRFAPDGRPLAELPLPVRCPTMPCFGGADLKTLYITTARDKRPADELAAQPLAGCVLQLRIPVPGLPAHLARL